MELWELAAREHVRDSIAAYTHAGDRGRLQDLAAVFTENGVLHVAGRDPVQGREAIVEMLSGAVERGSKPAADGRRGFVRHYISNIRFEQVGKSEIRTAAYFLVVTADGPDHWGRYRDQHVPVDDHWEIAHRYVRTDATVPGSVFAI
jgi:ketosteroid isomerase-like protein